MSDRKDAQSLRSVLVAAALSICGVIGGIVATIVIGDKLLKEYSVLVSCVLILLVTVVSLLTLYDFIEQARNKLSELQEAGKDIRESVPSLVTFIERRERIVVTKEGDGIFECFYKVRYNFDDENDINQLHFPIIIDIDEQTPLEERVKVERIQLEENSLPTDGYSAREIRRSMQPGVPSQQYGVVSIPVQLNRNRRTAKINTVIRYKGIFRDCHTSDYVIIDIPYVTESLSISIVHEKADAKIHKTNRAYAIEAICEMMDVSDRIEEIRQSQHINFGPKAIDWSTKSSKIGYRYKIWFRTAEQAV